MRDIFILMILAMVILVAAGAVTKDQAQRDAIAACDARLGQLDEQVQNLAWRAQWQEDRLRSMLGLPSPVEGESP